MSSFRSYSDAGAYKTRTGLGSGSTFGRNASTGSSYSNYRSNYAGIGSTSARAFTTKERNIGSVYSTNFARREGDKVEEKPSYKYSYTKNLEKERPTIKVSKEDSRSHSRCSSAGGTSSILDKYTLSSVGTKSSVERPSSMLDRYYSTGTSRETSREPDSCSSSKYGGSNSYSESSRSYSIDRKDKEQATLPSYRSLKTPSTRHSRELSPDTSSKSNAPYKMYSRTPTFGKSSNSPNTSESSSIPLSSKYSGKTNSARYPLSSYSNPERVTASISYTGSEKFRNPTTTSAPPSFREVIPKPQQNKNIKISSSITESDSQLDDTQAATSVQDLTNNNSTDNSTCSASFENDDNDVLIVTVVTRGTSPTPPPALTAYTRTKRLEPVPKPFKKEVKRSDFIKIETREQEQQVENRSSCESARYPRYNSSSSGRLSSKPWISSYLDKYNSSNAINSNSCTHSVNYGTSHAKTSSNYGFTKSNEKSCSLKESTAKSNSSHSRCNSNASSSSRSRDSISRSSDRSPIKPESSSARQSSEERKSDISREESPRIVEGQDNSQRSRQGSLNRSFDSSSSSSLSKPGIISRSSSLKSRQMTSPDSVKLPAGYSSHTSSGNSRSVSSKPASPAASSSATAAAAASMTKIKSATATTTAALPSTSGGKCATMAATGSSVTSRQASPADARDRKPPVPKSQEMVGKITPPAIGGSGIKYVNKDFRKSALNMENGDPSRSQITERKQYQKKFQRSMSISSQDSQSEANSESMPMQREASSGSSASIKSNKSTSKLKTSISKSNGVRKRDQKSLGKELRRSNSKSPMNGQISKISTSEYSTDGSTSELSDEEEGNKQRIKSDSSGRRTCESPFRDGKSKTSASSSRTSVLASSADELSVNTDKPPRPPSSPRSKSDRSGKTDEAKSFLMRALAPVTNLFKNKQQENTGEIKNGGWVDTDENSDIKNKSIAKNSVSKSISQSPPKSLNFTNAEKCDSRRARLKHQSSDEKPWWLDPNSDNVPEGVERYSSVGNDDISQDTTVSTALPDDGKFKFKIWRQDSGERAWWLDANDNIADEEQQSCPKEAPAASPTATTTSTTTTTNLSRKSSTRSARPSRDQRVAAIKRQQSGERAWWLSDDPENVPEGVEVIPVPPAASDEAPRQLGSRIRHIESGERAWWLDSEGSVPEGVRRISSDSNSDDSDESFERVDIGRDSPVPKANGGLGFSKFPLEDEPLGDRASPEGIENPPAPPDNFGGRTSPYDNVKVTRQTPPRRSAPRKRPSNLPLFIGNHTNIDDLLGETIGPGHSPNVSRRSRYSKDAGPPQPQPDSSDEDCEEIDPAQVIIHDSTPQTPVIQRRHRDVDRPQPDGYIPVRVPLNFSIPYASQVQ